jgi:plastocyanin
MKKRKKDMHKGIIAGIGAMFLMTLLLTACGVADNSVASGPQVRMGLSTFIDTTVTIHQGESVVLVDTVSSTHIITNGTWKENTPVAETEAGAPKVNVTVANAEQQQSIGPFTSPGSFQLYCTVHPGMNLAVSVK